MEDAKVGRHTSRKRQVSNFLKRVKQLDPLVYTNVGLSSELTSKKKKVVPESSLGRDQNWASPAKGQIGVVCALPANHSGAKDVQWSNNLAQTVQKNCVMNLEDDLALSHLVDERKRKVHSDPGNKHLLVSCKKKLSITSIYNHSPNLMEEKLDCFGWEICTNSPTTASFNLEVAGDTIGEVQNQEVPPDNSVDVVSKKADICQSETKRKGYSDRRNKHMSKSGGNKFSKTLVNSQSDQNMKEHILDQFGGKISTSLVAAVVNQKVNDDALCKVQNQEGPVDKSLEAASKAEDELDKACSSQPDVQGKRRSARRNTLELGSGRNTSVRVETLTNNQLDQNLNGEKSDQFNGKNSNSLKTSLFNQKNVNGDTSREVQKQAVALNKSTEAGPGAGEEHDELQKRRSDRIKKRMSESGATTSGIIASKDNQNGNNSTLCGVKNNEVQVNKGLVTASEVSDKQEELCGIQQKRKEMMHSDEKKKIKSQGVCRITKLLEFDNSDPETSDLDLMRNERNGDVLSDDNPVAMQSKSLFDCSNTDPNHTSCYETESSLVELQNVRTYQRKDKKPCYLTNNLEPRIGNDWHEVSISCSNDLTENGELEPRGEVDLNLGRNVVSNSDNEIFGKSTSFSLGGKLIAGRLQSSGAAESSCAPCSQNGDYVTDGDGLRGDLAMAHIDKVLPSPKHPVEQICRVTVDALAQDRDTLSEDVGNNPCIQNEDVVLGCITTDEADASKHSVEQICGVAVDALPPEGGVLSKDVGDDPCIQNQSVVLGRVSTDVAYTSKHPGERICDATVDSLAQESGTLSEDVVEDPCVQDQSVMLGCVSVDSADTSKHPAQEICDVTVDALAQERGALCEDVADDPCIQNQSVLGHTSTDGADASMVMIGGVSVHSRHTELYRQIVDRFGPFVHLESKEMKVWGHTTFVMLGEFLDTVARFLHVIHEDISEDDLEFLEIRSNKFDGFGFSVGWFQKYVAQLRELPSLDVRIREVEAQLVFAEQELNKLENRIQLSRIELGELRQLREASVDVFGTSAI